MRGGQDLVAVLVELEFVLRGVVWLRLHNLTN